MHVNRLRRVLLRFSAIAVLLVVGLGAVETLSQRRQRVQEMSAEQREDLFQNERQFRALAPDEQKRIRELHEQIENAPDRDKLRATMNRYCKWFETQPPYSRATLLNKKTVSERIEAVKHLLKVKGPSSDIRLDDKNRRALAAWLEHYASEHGSRFLENMNPMAAAGIAKLSPDRQQLVVRETLLRRWQGTSKGGRLPISDREMAALHAAISPELRARLDAKPPAERPRIVADWLRETASAELDQQLADFFENTISDEERDKLMSLPSDEMYDSLSKQYRAHVLKQSKPSDLPHHADRPPWMRGHRPGNRRPPEEREGKEPGPAKDSARDASAIMLPPKPSAKSGTEKDRPEKPADN